MTPSEILAKVTRALDIIARTGDNYHGLFPSLIDLNTHEMLTEMPTPIPGQRRGDRSYLGSNLIHDTPLLATMYGLASALNRAHYRQAADRYLQRFATHCTDTTTGLFPWGEHAFWHLIDDTIGNSSRYHDPNSTNPAIHDHLRAATLWLWDKLHEYNPKCVERFAEGLDYHWKVDPPEYSRHGDIEVKRRPESHDAASFDFPRHGGFYIFDWSFSYLKTGREDFRRQIVRMLEYWRPHRFDDGFLPSCSRSEERVKAFYQVRACGQTMGFAASLFDTAELLKDREPELASHLKEDALGYATAFVNAPHDLENGILMLGFRPGFPECDLKMPTWGSVYGIWPAATIAALCLLCYRNTDDESFLQIAGAMGQSYLKEPMPEDSKAPANDPGLALGLIAGLYEITGDVKWLNGGLELSEKLIDIYLDGDLPRGAAGIDWYESQMGPGFLLHGLARIALLAESRENCPLAAEYTSR